MKCDPSECSDGELAALTLAGRHDAFSEIMRRHREPVYRLVRGHIGHADEALDLVQECFTSAFKRLDSYDQERSMRAWLSQIAINKCRDWGRRRSVRRLLLFSQPLDGATGIADPAPEADVAMGDRQELGRLWSAIAGLPRTLKEPLILRTIEGMPQAEVAHILGISEKAVETRLYRARKKLAGLREPTSQGG